MQQEVSISQTKAKVLEFVKRNGPVLPSQVSQHAGTDIILASAILSELVSRKEIAISSARVGSSPVYYVKGQEYKLEGMLYNHLKAKEREAYDLLKRNNILRDSKLQPAHRVALRDLHDFAIPLNVKIGEGTETFWKFCSLSSDQARSMIENILVKKQEPRKEIERPAEKTIEKPSEKTIERPQPEVKVKPTEIKPRAIKKAKDKQVVLKELKEKKEMEKPLLPPTAIKDPFYLKIKGYLTSSGIHVLDEQVIKKKREFDFTVKVPSGIGYLVYYVKARNKKTINDADLSLAYSEGQQKKLPVLFLTTGKITKKAKVHAEKKLKGQLIFKEI